MFGGFSRRFLGWTLASVVLLAGCATVRDIRARPRSPEALLPFLRENIQFALTRIESDLDGTARMLERTGPSGGAARELLEGLSLRHPPVVAAFSARMDGSIVASEPIPHRTPASQPDDFDARIVAALSGAPGLRAIDGDATGAHVLWRPIPAFREYEETRVGAVVSLSRVFEEIVYAPGVGEPVDIWMVDTGGTIVADLNGDEVGYDIASDEMYAVHAEMSAVVRSILSRSSGRERYTYFGPDFIVVKDAGWQTVRLGGKEWRLVVEHVVEGDSGYVARLPYSFTPITHEQVIHDLAMDPRLINAAAESRPFAVQRVLASTYRRYPGLHNLQWMDANGVTQCGHPASRTLSEYDHHSGMRPGDDWLLDVLESGEPVLHTGRLWDGYEGEMIAVPVRGGGVNLGMVYATRRVDGM